MQNDIYTRHSIIRYRPCGCFKFYFPADFIWNCSNRSRRQLRTPSPPLCLINPGRSEMVLTRLTILFALSRPYLSLLLSVVGPQLYVDSSIYVYSGSRGRATDVTQSRAELKENFPFLSIKLLYIIYLSQFILYIVFYIVYSLIQYITEHFSRLCIPIGFVV